MDQLLTNDLWPSVRKMAKKAKRIAAAIAYFSSETNLKLRSGDLLVVDASDNAIRNGETSAPLLRRLHRRGVSIHNRSGLHAKVILIDQKAVIGSANASVSSTTLDEAAVLTTDPTVVSQARSFIVQLARNADCMYDEDIEKLCRIKVVRRGGAGAVGKRRRRIRVPGGNVWIVGVTEMEPEEYKNENKEIETAEGRIHRTFPGVDPDWVRYEGTSCGRSRIAAGDRLIVVSNAKKAKTPYEVCPPSTVLWRQDRKKWTRFYYDPRLSRPQSDIQWKEFQSLCSKTGIGRVSRYAERMLSPAEASELTRLWPTGRRKRK